MADLQKVRDQLLEASKSSISCSLASGAVDIAAVAILEMEGRVLEEGLKSGALSEDSAKAVRDSLGRIETLLADMCRVYKARSEQKKHEAAGLKQALDALDASDG